MTIGNILEFFIYIVPGFIAVEIYTSYYPCRQESQFRETTKSALIGISLFYVLKYLDTNHFSNFLIGHHIVYAQSAKFIVILLILGVVIGIILVIWRRLKEYLLNRFPILRVIIVNNDLNTWATLNKKDNKDWVIVYLKCGQIYLGWIKHYSLIPNEENQDFLLTKAKRVDDNLRTIYIIDGKGVYINTRDISHLEYASGVMNEQPDIS
ncbi:DUF6338 family protein [Candidatus Margulisiibacteriota bacterium]